MSGATAPEGKGESAPAEARGEVQPGWLPLLNVSTSWASQLVSIAGSLIVTPALIHGLGEALYGGWLLITSFVGQLRTLDLGMSAGTLKFTSGALARGDRAALRRIHSSSSAVFLIAATLALAATGALALALPRLFPRALAGQEGVILVLGGAASLDLLLHPQPASLRSRSLYFIPDSVELLTYSVFKLGLVLWLARTGISLWALCLLILGESLARNLLLGAGSLWLCDWTRQVSPRAVDRATLRTLAAYGGGTFLINVGELIRFQLDSAVIGYFLTAASIAVYSVGMRLIHIAYQAIGVIGAISIPRFSGLHERGDREGYERLLHRANRVTDLATAYILVNIALLGQPFLQLWIRKPWVPEAFGVTLIMLPAYFVGLLTGPGAGLLMGAGRLRGMTVLTLVEAGCNLGLSVLLARPLGIYGVCLGTAIPMVLFRGVAFPFVLRGQVGIPVWSYYRSHLAGVGVVLLYGLLLVPLRWLTIDTPVAFVLAGLASSALFGLLVLAAFPEIRGKVLGRLRRAPA